MAITPTTRGVTDDEADAQMQELVFLDDLISLNAAATYFIISQ
jgi:hypothetical protein